MQTAKRMLVGCATLIALSIVAQSPLAAAPDAVPAKGPLRVHPTNPRYFTDGTKNADGSLKAVFLTGSHTFGTLCDYRERWPAVDFTAYLDFLQRYHHNFIRLWSGDSLGQKPVPYARTGPGTAKDGGLKVDLDRFDQAFFDRLRSRVVAARDRGMYVGIMLFSPDNGAKREDWDSLFFNPVNNVQRIDADTNKDGSGAEAYDLSTAKITAYQEAYVRKVIDTVNDLDNVLYEIGNEGDLTSVAWQYHFIRFIKKYEADKPKQHPVGMTAVFNILKDAKGNWGTDNRVLMESPADWISPAHTTAEPYKRDPPAADGTKVIIADVDHIWPAGPYREWAWKCFLRGLQPIHMDQYTYGDSKQFSRDDQEAIRKCMGYTLTYAGKMNLAAMTPQNDLASTKYCLANPGIEYLVYQPEAGEAFSVDLKAGSYHYEWFDPAKGIIANRGRIESSGGRQEFKAVFDGDAVLYFTAASSHPHTWERWEHSLKSARSYDNPYADVTLRVTYTGRGGRTLRAFGFWDGGDTFLIRCAFPEPGTWQWETKCSDAANTGLHKQSGTVNVSLYAGDNPLYRHGFLKVSDNRRYLAHADKTPFLWIGDTAWGVPHKASPEEWEQYIVDRAAKHFTVIQVAAAREWGGDYDRQGQKAFTDNKTCGQWNPAYWQSFDRKVQRANESGFVVMLVGLMEPVVRYPESDKACLFARNIVARLFGNLAVFSPSFDSEVLPLAHEVGRAARDATAAHLVTQHPGTPWNEPVPTFSIDYYDQPYLDFVAVQTGHNAGHLDWCAHHAIEWNLDLYRHEPHKPVINLEAMYDGQGTSGWRAVDARSLGWRTWLSGGAGYTYGAGESPSHSPGGDGGIWMWSTDPKKPDYWKKALQWESAFQMQYLHDFLSGIQWWRLEPAHHLIRNQPDDVTRRMVLAKSAEGDLTVAYLPDNDAIEIDLTALPATGIAARWFDPVHGRYTPIAGNIETKATHRFTPPRKGEWVLLLQRKA